MNKKKIFAAFSWDPLVKQMYKRILKTFSDKWEIQYGSEYDSGNQTRDEIRRFIERNETLFNRFVKGIKNSDLFIADITGLNPNVLIELGVAINLNKKVLIFSRDDYSKLPFDIQHIEIDKYHNSQQLKKRISHYLDIFLQVVQPSFENASPDRKFSFMQTEHLFDRDIKQIQTPSQLRNLRIRVEFKFIVSRNHNNDWFGIYMRAQNPNRFNSELVLVRYSGVTRSLSWPERRPEFNGSTVVLNSDNYNKLEVLIEENHVTAWVNDNLALEDPNVSINSFGDLWVGCWDHREFPDTRHVPESRFLDVEFRNVEVINLDTQSIPD